LPAKFSRYTVDHNEGYESIVIPYDQLSVYIINGSNKTCSAGATGI